MSDNLNIRLNYMGGKVAGNRMSVDKLRTLKKALLYSYQAATATLEDGRDFRCLINPDKLKNDYDNKIISIPFSDFCLNSEISEEEEIGMKVGDIFTWKETGTDWLVYLRYLEEDAYFRAEIRLCNGAVDIGGKTYKAYVRGPVETDIKWNQKKGISYNTLNYSRILYIKEDDITANLKRFDIIKMDGNNWEVQVVNKDTASDGIMVIYLNEHYNNSIKDELFETADKEEENGTEDNIENTEVVIMGDAIVYPYDTKTYSIEASGGTWTLSNNKAKIVESNDNTVKIEIITGRAANVDLKYTLPSGEEYVLPLVIKSL